MKVWIDDIRDPVKFTGQTDHVWLKTFQDGLDYVTNHLDSVTELFLDNDLADKDDRQGRHILNFVEEQVYFGRMPSLKAIYIHSDNTPAVISMLSSKDVFERFGVELKRNSFLIK